MKRDLLIGVLAGAVALAVMRSGQSHVPPGIYQTATNQRKFREMEQALAPTTSTIETRKKLETRIDKFEVKNARLDWLLGYLADVAGVDIDAEWSKLKYHAPPERTITLELYNVPVIEALHQVLAQAGPTPESLGMRIEPGRVIVSLGDRLNQEQVMRVYDVHDLLAMLTDSEYALRPERGPIAPPSESKRPDWNRTPRSWLDFVTTKQEAAEILVRFTEENIDPPSWRDFGGVSAICFLADKMIITQSRDNHDRIMLLMEQLRRPSR